MKWVGLALLALACGSRSGMLAEERPSGAGGDTGGSGGAFGGSGGAFGGAGGTTGGFGGATGGFGGATGGFGGATGGAGGTGGTFSGCAPGEAPVLLAKGLTNLLALAIDDTHVYTSLTDTAVVRLPKAGGAVETLAWSGANVLAVDATHVYWFAPVANLLHSVPKEGGAVVTVATTPTHTQEIAVDSMAVYWSSSGFAQVLRAHKPSGVAQLLYEPTPPASAVRIALDGFWVYAAHQTGIIGRFSNSGGPLTPLGDAGAAISDMIVDEGFIYVSLDGSGVLRIPKIGGDAVEIAPVVSPRWMAQDGDNLYVASKQGAIVRVSKSGAGSSTLPTAQTPWFVAVDASCVYWTAAMGSDAPSLWRAPKP